MNKGGDRLVLFLLGSFVGATAALLLAPESGVRTRRKMRRRAEDATDYIVDAGRNLADQCEDLYRRCANLATDEARELSQKYRDLMVRGQQLADETAAMTRR